MGRIQIKVTPKSSRNAIRWKNDVLHVYITAPPEKGKANKEIEKYLKKVSGIPVKVIRGEKSRNKVIEFSVETEEFIRRLKNGQNTH